MHLFCFRFFTKKWSKNVNYDNVKKIYEKFISTCPCQYIIAFNICRLDFYMGYSNLLFNNMFTMRSLHFSQKITDETEKINIQTIYNKTNILSTDQYNILIENLPASTQVNRNKKIKDRQKKGVEQVSKMLKGNLNKTASLNINNSNKILGKKYQYCFPMNKICVYNKSTTSLKKDTKMNIIKSIMKFTEDYKNKINSGAEELSICKHVNFTTEFRQLRAADEAEHRISICNDCGRIFNINS